MKLSGIFFAMALIGIAGGSTLAQQTPGDRPRGAGTARSAIEARIKERFGQADTNRDGALDSNEARVYSEANRAERRSKIFARIDSNSDGMISRDEFAAPSTGPGHMAGKRGGGQRRQGGGMFARADTDSDGRVTLAEALALPLQKFDQADTNRDAAISPEERKAARQMRREMRRTKQD